MEEAKKRGGEKCLGLLCSQSRIKDNGLQRLQRPCEEGCVLETGTLCPGCSLRLSQGGPRLPAQTLHNLLA